MKLITLVLVCLLLLSAEPRRRRGVSSLNNKRVGSTLGKGLAALAAELKYGDEDEDVKVVSGKQAKQQFNSNKMHEEIEYSILNIVIYTFFAIAILVGFLYCNQKMKNEEPTVNMDRIREQRRERNKNYATLNAIAEHGVHPDRANGKIYKINL